MIKQNWNINEEERRRILRLHEAASKNNYLVIEQDQAIDTEIEKGLNPKEFAKKYGLKLDDRGEIVRATDQIELQFNFASGFWSTRATSADGTTTIVNQVNNAVQEVRSFLSQFFIPRITRITVSSGESAVPNKDNEDPETPRLAQGVLATRRSQTIQALLGQQLQSLATSGLVKQIPEIQVAQPVIGSATVKNSPEAIAEQFVTATIQVVGLVKESCNLNVDIQVEYKPVGSSDAKYHNCNDAEFTLLLNNVPIICNETGTDIFSLNNYPNGDAKKQTLTVTPEKAAQILGISDTVEVSFKCRSAKCHEAPLLMTVFSNGKKVGGPSYMGTAKNREDRMPQNEIRKVATMDKCGKIISVEDFFSKPDTTKTKQ